MYWGVEAQIHAFLTSALDGSCQLHALVALTRGKSPLVSTGFSRLSEKNYQNARTENLVDA